MSLFGQKLVLHFREQEHGDNYTIEFRKAPMASFYTMYCHERPTCTFPLGTAAHLLEGNLICVNLLRRPRTLDQAKAIALAWMYGFSQYLRSGVFPNGKFKANVAEV